MTENENGKQPILGLSEIHPQTQVQYYPYGIGLTKREYFASMAMQGLMNKDYVKLHIDGSDEKLPIFTNVKMVAQMALAIADELLNQLNQPS